MKLAVWCFAAGYLAAALIGFWPVFYALIILLVVWAVFKAPIRRAVAEHQDEREKRRVFDVGPDGVANKRRKQWWK